MNDRDAWRIYFAGIASIRLHPRNVVAYLEVGDQPIGVRTPAPKVGEELAFAARVADIMLKLEKETWPG